MYFSWTLPIMNLMTRNLSWLKILGFVSYWASWTPHPTPPHPSRKWTQMSHHIFYLGGLDFAKKFQHTNSTESCWWKWQQKKGLAKVPTFLAVLRLVGIVHIYLKDMTPAWMVSRGGVDSNVSSIFRPPPHTQTFFNGHIRNGINVVKGKAINRGKKGWCWSLKLKIGGGGKLMSDKSEIFYVNQMD